MIAFSMPLFILVVHAAAQVMGSNNFTIVNGLVFTPGLAIVDAPQPYTPVGGGELFSLSSRFSTTMDIN